MSTLEALLRVAAGQGEAFDNVRNIIGVGELSVLIASELLKRTSLKKVKPSKVSEALKMPESTAKDWVANIAVKESSTGGTVSQ